MKRVVCVILAVLLCVAMIPVSAFAEEAALYTATVDVISTECSNDACQVYIYDDDCYMYIDDIVRYTRSTFTVEGDILTVTHGTRDIKIDLANNELTEDGIAVEMKTLHNGDAVVVHAFPMLTYLGATCDVGDGYLTINMPEQTLWEGLVRTGKENDYTLEVFGGEMNRNLMLLFNGILELLESGLCDVIFTNNRKEVIMMAAQVDPLKYKGATDALTAAAEKQAGLLSNWASSYDNVNAVWNTIDTWGSPALDVAMYSIEKGLITEKTQDAFDSVDLGIDSIAGVMDFYAITMKDLSAINACTEDSLLVFEALAENVPDDSKFYDEVLDVKKSLSNKGEASIKTTAAAALQNTLDNLPDIVEKTAKKMAEANNGKLSVKAESVFGTIQLLDVSLDAGVWVVKLMENILPGRDSFAFADAQTSALYLMYLKTDIAEALDELAQTILSENYSNEQHIEDYRLMTIFYYKTLIAMYEQFKNLLIAEYGINSEHIMDDITKFDSDINEFSQRLYVLTAADGVALPNVDEVSKSNKWDGSNVISTNMKEVPNGLEGLGAASMTLIFGGIEADSIQYYNCSETGNFAVIEKNGKYGLIDYSGNIILPIEYESIEPRETNPGGQEIKLYAYDSNYNGYWIEQNGSLTSEFLGGWGFEGGAEIYWWNEPVMFDYFEGKVPYSYEAYASYYHGSNVLGTITKGTADIIPVQQINGLSQTTSNGMTTYTVKKVSEKYALLNLKTQTLITDFVFDDYGYSGFIEGILAVHKENKWGYIDENGKMITDFIYDTSEVTPWANNHMYSSLNNHIIVRQGDLWGLIDNSGNIVVETAYDGISQVNSNGMFWLKENGTWSLYQLDEQ